MYRLAKQCGLIFLAICLNATADSLKPDRQVVEKTLTLLPGQAQACNAALSNLQVHVRFSYFIIPNVLLGSAFAVVKNPTAGNPPVLSELYQSGESDRLGFAHYYGLRGIPMNQDGKQLYLGSVILDVCPDHSSEAAVVMNVPNPLSSDEQSCILATPTWDHYCR